MVYGRGLEQYQAHTKHTISINCCHLILPWVVILYQVVQSISCSYSLPSSLPSPKLTLNLILIPALADH